MLRVAPATHMDSSERPWHPLPVKPTRVHDLGSDHGALDAMPSCSAGASKQHQGAGLSLLGCWAAGGGGAATTHDANQKTLESTFSCF